MPWWSRRTPHRYQREILRRLNSGPELMDQIGYWLKHGQVGRDKIVSLWKCIAKAIPEEKSEKAWGSEESGS
jgi:hypothetical protein